METLAYLHLFCAYEASEEPELTLQFDWRQFSSQTSLFTLKLLVPLGILLTAGSALALQRGDSGSAVMDLQNALKTAGYFNATPTGFYGSITEEAVRQLQQDKGLRVDGVAGSATLQSLRNCANVGTIRPVSFTGNGVGSLRLGSRGTEVTQIQRQLINLGYTLRVDGVFGSETERAVRDFQTTNRLVADGVVGPATRSALNSGMRVRPIAAERPDSNSGQPISTTGALRRGDRGEAVRGLQTQLWERRFYTGSIDGVFGAETEDSVMRFQRVNGLVADGVVGATTRNALNATGEQRPGTTTPPQPPAVNASGVLQRGDRGETVSRLQEQLRDRGFYNGPIDGVFGGMTEDAVSRFQRANFLVATGRVDSETRARLGNLDTVASRYVVIIPIASTNLQNSVQNVRQYVGDAYLRNDQRGMFIHAGSYTNRQQAEKRATSLRQVGFDSRVEYF
jgi:peptidoglycan hydrolase-like protein with peptidoglycan-binding domain